MWNWYWASTEVNNWSWVYQVLYVSHKQAISLLQYVKISTCTNTVTMTMYVFRHLRHLSFKAQFRIWSNIDKLNVLGICLSLFSFAKKQYQYGSFPRSHLFIWWENYQEWFFSSYNHSNKWINMKEQRLTSMTFQPGFCFCSCLCTYSICHCHW